MAFLHSDKPSKETPYRVMHFLVTFKDDILGTASANPDIHADYIASKSPNAMTRAEEIEAIGAEAYDEKSMTVFPRLSTDPDVPIFWNYQIRGFFKESCGMLQKAKNKYLSPASLQIRAYKKIIDGVIFTAPREVPIDMHGLKIDTLERPLRAQTAQGERVALAKSECVPAGSTIEFYVCDYSGGQYEDAVREWMDYGAMHGMGQWRNSGKGVFDWEELPGYFITLDEVKALYMPPEPDEEQGQ